MIDKLWTDHLQYMTELKESVHNAVYENKDPILVFKFEGIKAFKKLIHNINVTITRHLFTFQLEVDEMVLDKSGLVPVEAHLQANKEESNVKEAYIDQEKVPVVIKKIFGRNDRVTVRYTDNTVKKDVKYKVVAEDIAAGHCVVTSAEKG